MLLTREPREFSALKFYDSDESTIVGALILRKPSHKYISPPGNLRNSAVMRENHEEARDELKEL